MPTHDLAIHDADTLTWREALRDLALSTALVATIAVVVRWLA